jgi:AraC family transcriptional regulator of adaptative response/methylated-DNA-[protein]-cysteine methyltransferase
MKQPLFADEHARWQAVVQRDARADGAFVYAVRTTGVYCRCTCPARRPRQTNVAYFATCQAAEKAGYRSCLRCRPRDVSPEQRQIQLVTRLCRQMEAAPSELTLSELAQSAGLSAFHLQRTFKAHLGITPKQYAATLRAERARRSLQSASTVTQAIYQTGYESSGRFYADMPGTLGMTPTEFRSGGRGVAIKLALGQCWLGAILVAASDQGICAISLGDDAEALLREFQDRFPAAPLCGGDRQFKRWVAKVIGFVNDPARGFELPLDIRGTAFQRQVWEALRKIPPGTTLSYSELAARLGRPRATRAVASACAANVLAVAIPCHRIVRTNGSLSGYRWGVQRKRSLLEREQS